MGNVHFCKCLKKESQVKNEMNMERVTGEIEIKEHMSMKESNNSVDILRSEPTESTDRPIIPEIEDNSYHSNTKQIKKPSGFFKSPLEIINETNTESFNDSFKLSEEKKRKTLENFTPINIQLKSVNSTHSITSENKNAVKKSFNVNEETNTNTSIANSKVKKKESAWKNILITTIIPESRLLSENKEEIMFQGMLDKFTPSQNKKQNSTYMPKFIICTKYEIKMYKSKETFLKMQNPSLKIPFNTIACSKRINLSTAKSNKSNKILFHFYIQIGVPDSSINASSFTKSQISFSEDDKSILKILINYFI